MGEHDTDRYRVQGPVSPPLPRTSEASYELTKAQSQQLDQRAISEYAIPSILLMENAAIGLREHVLAIVQNENDPSVWICCGPGNNGGDGLALARHLHNASVRVRVICTQPPEDYRGDPASYRTMLEHLDTEIIHARALLDEAPVLSPTLIVDAIFGTGLSRAVDGIAAELIQWINRQRGQRGVRVLSVDIPSGLDADTGKVLGSHAVSADITLTMACLKPCMARVDAHDFLGEVHVVPIGAPIELLRSLGVPITPKHRE